MDSIVIYRRQIINREEPKKAYETNIVDQTNEAKVIMLEALTNSNKIKTPTLLDNDIPMIEYIKNLLVKNNLEDLTIEDVINTCDSYLK